MRLPMGAQSFGRLRQPLRGIVVPKQEGFATVIYRSFGQIKHTSCPMNIRIRGIRSSQFQKVATVLLATHFAREIRSRNNTIGDHEVSLITVTTT